MTKHWPGKNGDAEHPRKGNDRRSPSSVSTATAPASHSKTLACPTPSLSGGGTGVPFAEDLIWGARNIAIEIWAIGDNCHRRKVYHLHQTARTPIVKIGATLVVRRSTLRRWLEEMEQQGLSGKRGIPSILKDEADPILLRSPGRREGEEQ